MEESRFVLVWELPVGVEVGVLKEVFLVSLGSALVEEGWEGRETQS